MFTRLIKTALAAMLLTSPCVASAADTTLELWTNRAPNPDNARGEALNHVLRTFEEKHPGVKINVTVLDWKEISPALLRAVRSKQPPDIAMVYSPYLRTHVAAGSIQPLDQFMDDKTRADVIALPVAQADGKTFALPWEIRVMGFIYREDLFGEAGAAFPTTHAQLTDALKSIDAKHRIGGYGVSFDPVRSVGALEWFMPMAAGMGAKILNDDGTAAFNDPAVVELLTAFKGLVNDGVIRLDQIFVSGDEMQQRFDSGRVAMFNDGTQQLDATRESSGLGSKVAWAPIPDFVEGKATPAVLNGWNLVIPEGSGHSDLAWELIKYWTSPEMQAYQAQKAGYLPANREVIRDPAYDKPEYAHIKRAFAAIDRGTLQINWPENSELLNDVLARMVSEVLADRLTIEQAIAKAEESYNGHLK